MHKCLRTLAILALASPKQQSVSESPNPYFQPPSFLPFFRHCLVAGPDLDIHNPRLNCCQNDTIFAQLSSLIELPFLATSRSFARLANASLGIIVVTAIVIYLCHLYPGVRKHTRQLHAWDRNGLIVAGILRTTLDSGHRLIIKLSRVEFKAQWP
jgi:hypothetical protein